MDLILYIKNNLTSDILRYNLSQKNEVLINELDYVLFEIISDSEIISECKFILGNTIINIDITPYKHNSLYYYYLDKDDLNSLLLSENYFSKSYFNTDGLSQKFSKLFINELGNCTPQIKNENEIISYYPIKIKSPKIDDDNFSFIIRYLMFNSYFDENIIYKNTIDSNIEKLNTSFLEVLKELFKRSKEILDNVQQFQFDSIKNFELDYVVKEHNLNSSIDNNSLDWLLANISDVEQVSHHDSNYSFKVNNKRFKTRKILEPTFKSNYNVYENRIILGFLSNLLKSIKDRANEFENQRLRTRDFSTFSEYLRSNLNKVIQFYLDSIAENFLSIKKFFENELGVKEMYFEFPLRTEGFLRKMHYRRFLDLMLFSKNLFSLKATFNSNLKVEIESFDKLYEVYCLYFIKDSISEHLNVQEKFIPQFNSNNKLKGEYQFVKNNISINLFYETLPENIHQLAKANSKYHENPDFIVCIKIANMSYYIILDAKYKVYNSPRFNKEISSLSHKYLHRIGSISKNDVVLGLYTISINKISSVTSIYKRAYDLGSKDMRIPQIGKIQLNSKNIRKENNPILEILTEWISWAKYETLKI